MSAITISGVTRRDLRRVLAIEEASFPDPWSDALLRGEIEMLSSRRYTKATVGRRVVGYLGLMFVDDEVHVNTLATDPEARGRGVATRLLLDGIDAALRLGGRHLTLEVAASNEGAQSLYRRFGLAPVGVRRGYYAGGEDAIVMWCRDLDSEHEVARRTGLAESLGSNS